MSKLSRPKDPDGIPIIGRTSPAKEHLRDDLPYVMAGIASYRDINTKTMGSILETMARVKIPWDLKSHQTANIPECRNVLCRLFMETEPRPDYLWFIDCDMVFQPEAFALLLQTMEENREIGVLSGFYTRRDESYGPLVGWTHDDGTPWEAAETMEKLLEERGEVVEAELLPTGFMLIRREVLEDVEEPWFHLEWPYLRREGKSEAWKEQWAHRLHSSDNVFCRNAREAGWKTYAHLGAEVGHIGQHIFHPEGFYQRATYFRSLHRIEKAKAEAGERLGWNTPEYWDRIYEVEDQVGKIRDYPHLHAAIVAACQPGWRVADLGSGPGVLADKLGANKASDVVCYDISEFAISQCEEKGHEGRTLDLVDGDLYPNEHKAYDMVVCTEVLEHVEDPEKVVRKAYSMLKPGGLFAVSVPNNCLPPEEEPEHVRTVTPAQLGTWLQAFDNVDINEVQQYLLGFGVKPE